MCERNVNTFFPIIIIHGLSLVERREAINYLAELPVETPAWNLHIEWIQAFTEQLSVAIRLATEAVIVVIDVEDFYATVFSRRQHIRYHLDLAFGRKFCSQTLFTNVHQNILSSPSFVLETTN